MLLKLGQAVVMAWLALSADGSAHARQEGRAHAAAASPVPSANDRSQAIVEMDGASAPRLRAEIARVGGGRHELRLVTENFTFLTDTAGGSRMPGSGSAFLYLDGREAVRIDAPSMLLPALAPGVRTVDVELVAGDHALYVVDGRAVRTRVLLRVGARRGADAIPPVREFTLAVEGGRVRESLLRAVQGETIRIHWRSDAPLTVHLHGYDIEAELAPDSPLTMQFDADTAGRFPIARHGSRGGHGHGHRALLHLEVHPK